LILLGSRRIYKVARHEQTEITLKVVAGNLLESTIYVPFLMFKYCNREKLQISNITLKATIRPIDRLAVNLIETLPVDYFVDISQSFSFARTVECLRLKLHWTQRIFFPGIIHGGSKNLGVKNMHAIEIFFFLQQE
jgi:hypothetical protein